MTDYERHAARMFGDMYEVASVLGSHGFRCAAARAGKRTLVDAVTGEPIALLGENDSHEFATWLETEHPLPPRPVRYTLARLESGRTYAIGPSSVDGGGVDEPVELERRWPRHACPTCHAHADCCECPRRCTLPATCRDHGEVEGYWGPYAERPLCPVCHRECDDGAGSIDLVPVPMPPPWSRRLLEDTAPGTVYTDTEEEPTP